jgi:hypothetical protein
MSAEQTPDIADVLAEHEWLQYVEYGPCSCGDLTAFTAATHRAHVAAVLAPVLAAAVREARAAELRRAADEHEAELVCCDVFERLRDKSPADYTDADRSEYRAHSICYWGAACAEGDRDRADRITEPVSHEAATSSEEASKA